jgi:hypothetical protein
MKSITIAAILVSLVVWEAAGNPRAATVQVFKSPICGCCSKWVALVKTPSYDVRVTDQEQLDPIKDRYRVPRNLRSCHTSIIENYVFEGHVPIDLITKVLSERPRILGLAVAGMPVGSPGMEINGIKQRYRVVAFDAAGAQTTYAER